MVFWRETGIKDDEDDVDARDGACSIETAMVKVVGRGLPCQSARGASCSGAVARALAGRRPGRRQRSRRQARQYGVRSVQRDCAVSVCALGVGDSEDSREITFGRRSGARRVRGAAESMVERV